MNILTLGVVLFITLFYISIALYYYFFFYGKKWDEVEVLYKVVFYFLIVGFFVTIVILILGTFYLYFNAKTIKEDRTIKSELLRLSFEPTSSDNTFEELPLVVQNIVNKYRAIDNSSFFYSLAYTVFSRDGVTGEPPKISRREMDIFKIKLDGFAEYYMNNRSKIDTTSPELYIVDIAPAVKFLIDYIYFIIDIIEKEPITSTRMKLPVSERDTYILSLKMEIDYYNKFRNSIPNKEVKDKFLDLVMKINKDLYQSSSSSSSDSMSGAS